MTGPDAGKAQLDVPAATTLPPAERHREVSGWIPQLDGLRGLAALLVVLAHFDVSPIAPSVGSFYALFVTLRSWSLASLAVIFFYVLSAFLLTYVLVREQDVRGTVDVRRFYLRRVLRIWPLYLTLVVVNLISASPFGMLTPPSGGDPATWSWVREHVWIYLGFVGNWSLALSHIGDHVDRSPPGLAVLWSIALEEQFYLVYPLLMVAALASRRRAGLILAGAIALGWGFRLTFVGLVAHHSEVSSFNRLYYATLTYADVLAFGCLAGWLAVRRPPWIRMFERAMNRPLSGLLLALPLVGLSAAWLDGGWAAGGVLQLVAVSSMYGVAGVVMSLVVLWAVVVPRAPMVRLLASGPLRALGLLSYGIYVWHPLILAYARHELGTVEATTPAEVDALVLTTLGLYLGGTFAAAALSYRLVERPFLHLKDHLGARARRSEVPRVRRPGFRWQLVGAAGIVTALTSTGFVQVWFGPANLDRVGRVLPVRLGQRWLADDAVVTAFYVDAPHVRTGAAMLGTAAAPTLLASGQTAFDARRGELFAFDDAGQATLLVGRDRQRARLINLGLWEQSSGQLGGLDLVSRRGRWQIETAGLAPANPNSRFEGAGEPGLPAGPDWRLEPTSESLEVERLTDDLGPFLRIRALTSQAAIRLSSREPLSGLDGAPVTVLAIVRTSTPGLPIVLEVVDARPGSERHVTATESSVGDRWDRHSLQVDAVIDPDPGDEYALAVDSLRAGEWLDIRELVVFVGIVPR